MSGDQDDLDLEEQADAVADFVEELLGVMDIDAIAEPAIEGDRFYVDILEGPPEDLGLLIGKHGQTLDAIQELTRNIVGRRLDERIRVLVDVEDYRKRRAAHLEERAHRRGRAARFHDRQRRQLGQRHAIEQRPARRAAPTCRGHELTGVTHDS